MKVYFTTLSNINPSCQVQPEGLLSVKIVIEGKNYEISEDNGRLTIIARNAIDIQPKSSNHISVGSI